MFYGTFLSRNVKIRHFFVAKNWIPRCEPKKRQICSASRLHILSRSVKCNISLGCFASVSSCLILASLSPIFPFTCIAPLASALASLPILHVIKFSSLIPHTTISKPNILLDNDQAGGGRLRRVHLDQVSTPELHFRLFRAEYVD